MRIARNPSWNTIDGLVYTVPQAARELIRAFWRQTELDLTEAARYESFPENQVGGERKEPEVKRAAPNSTTFVVAHPLLM